MYLGDQWDVQEKQKLFSENRNTYTYNFCRRNINLMCGYQIKHRLSSIILPQEKQYRDSTDEMTDLITHVFSSSDFYKYESEAFKGAAVTGWNFLNIYKDYRDDMIDGDIKFGRDPYSGYITDPYFTRMDLSDCSNVERRKYISLQQAQSILPKQKRELAKLHKLGYSRDDKFTWLPYQVQPDGHELMAYNEYYKQGWEPVPYLINMETGTMLKWEGDDDQLAYTMRSFPHLKLMDKQEQYVECHIIVNDQHMDTIRNQYGLNSYPFVPEFATFIPECDYYGLKLQSYVRPMIDPQKGANKLRSQISDMIQSQITTGFMAKKSVLTNPTSLYGSGQGKVVFLEDNYLKGDVERIAPPEISAGLFQLMGQFDQDITTVFGVNEAAYGETSNPQESGLTMQMRQSSALVNIQEAYENLRFARKVITEKTIKLIQTWSPEKIERILGRPPTAQFYTKDFVKYQISIQEGVLTDTQQQLYFKQLLDLYQLTSQPSSSPITPVQLIEAAPIQHSSQLNKEVSANMQQQSQQAQQVSQLQLQKAQAEIATEKASAIEKLMGAKERNTRAISNLGLEDERTARAVDDRAQAAFERVKAMKELEGLSDDKFIKYATIIMQMEQHSQQSEERIKAQDVAIASQGQSAQGTP